jgi:carboxymethylenebutenolidase
VNTFQRYLAEEFAEDFEEGRLPRPEAFRLITSVTGSAATAETLLAARLSAARLPAPRSSQVQPGSPASPAPPASVAADDPSVQAEAVAFPGADAPLSGYLARPKRDGRYPVILVCHENRGLTEHICDVARRLAKAGYVALAVDLLSRLGGTAAVSPDDVPGLLANQPPDQFAGDFRRGWDFVAHQPFADSARLGMVGFCFGGGVTWLAATRMPELRAAVPFYGPHPPLADVPAIRAAVLGIYAGRDERINQGIPAIEAAMQASGKTFEKVIYPGVDHAFLNDTGPRYAPEAARDAWGRMMAWFERYVRPA